MKVAIHGYAIVSADDRIADSSGAMPQALRNDADWAYFQAGLDRADWVALGRVSHEATPNFAGRRRLVMSRRVRGLMREADGLWWNPLDMSWAEVCEKILPDGGVVAVPGGQAAFDVFLTLGFDGFHLSRATQAKLPGGRGLFSACEAGRLAEEILTEARLTPGPIQRIDPVAGVTLTVWGRKAADTPSPLAGEGGA